MKKKRLFLLTLGLAGVFALASCNDNTEADNLKKEIEALKSEKSELETKKNELETKNSDLETKNKELEEDKEAYKNGEYFTVNVTDFLGNTKTNHYLLSEYDNVLDAVKADNKIDVAGSWINSVNDSFTDYNWSNMIYENGESSYVGINQLEINKGDVFDIKFECWNTVESGYGSFDSYDVLVDQVIYNYAINKLGKKLENVNTWTSNTYWDSLFINLAIKNGYDTNVFTKDVFNTAYQQSLTSTNLNEAVNESVNNYFKYYYSARLFNNNFDDLKTLYGNYLENIASYDVDTQDYYAPEYTLPFLLSAAKTLGLDSKINLNTKTTSYRPTTAFGPEGYAWFLTGYASYNTISDSEFSPLTFDAIDGAYQKDVAIATYLLAYAATNQDARTLKSGETDIIEYLFDNYFDTDTFEFDAEKAENDMSSNQIYAALLAYKIQRDKKSATILFE